MAVFAMIALGVWQLQRMQQKQLRLQSIAQKYVSAPMHPFAVSDRYTDIRDVPVRVTGTLQSEKVVLIDNQIQQGQPGYDVLVPMLTQQKTLLVNMGWVAGSNDRTSLPKIDFPKGEVTLEGVLLQPQLNPMVTETQTNFTHYPLVLQQVDIELLNQQWQSTLPMMIVQRLDSQSAIDLLPSQWHPVVMSPEKHLGYAIQWFGLAIAAVIIFFSVILRRAKQNDS